MTDTALALIEPKNIELHFKPNGLDPIIERVRDLVSGFVADISTEKGRKEIASMAYKVAKSKTTLDGMGKDLVAGRKEEIKAIDAERKRAWDALEAIQHEVRAPLTEWENREKERVAAHETAIADLAVMSHGLEIQTAETLQGILAGTVELYGSRDWQEFATRAKQTFEQVIYNLQTKLEVRRKYEADQAELARLRQEEADRQQRERDERLQAEAAAAARAEADAALTKAAREREEAEARAAKAEADRQAVAEQAERDRVAAAEQAQRDAEAAAQAERDRIAAEQKAEADAQATREANKRHRAKINGEAMKGLTDAGLSHDTALLVIDAASRGQIPHLKLVY